MCAGLSSVADAGMKQARIGVYSECSQETTVVAFIGSL